MSLDMLITNLQKFCNLNIIYKGQKNFAKNSVKNLKNAQKYSKNNGEGPNSI